MMAYRQSKYAVTPQIVRLFISDVLDHRELGSLIDKYELDEFSNDLAEIVTDSETAEQLIGMERDAAHRTLRTTNRLFCRPSDNESWRDIE